VELDTDAEAVGLLLLLREEEEVPPAGQEMVRRTDVTLSWR
jgi:hypothetical protein